MSAVQFTVKVPVTVKKKAAVYVSSCQVLDIHSQGKTEREAKKNIIEAIKLFIVTCFERGTLDAVLKECGFTPSKRVAHFPKDHKFVSVPIPFKATGSCSAACHA